LNSKKKASKKAVALMLLALVLILALASLSFKEVYGASVSLAVVRGSSMKPLLHEGDIVFVVHKSPSEIKVGDIVVYRSVRGHLIIHRVITVLNVSGHLEYVTKGDNNPYDDSFLNEFSRGRGVTFERVIGVVWAPHGMVFKIPFIGYITLLLRG